MEIEYERNLAGSYMKAAAASDDSFDEKIMLKNKMLGLLRWKKAMWTGKEYTGMTYQVISLLR